MTKIPSKPNTDRPRRTQAERSDAMRNRLIEATLDCLKIEGYSGATVGKIAGRAQVSHGAPMHHFVSKAALIAAAAETLIRRVYVQLGHAIVQAGTGEGRLDDMVFAVWRSVFSRRDYVVMLELLTASRHDEELASIMHTLWSAAYGTISAAAEHYFEPIKEGTNVRQIMILTQWLMRGMTQDIHLVKDEQIFERFLKVWCDMLSQHIRPRLDVTTPPPKPSYWDSGL